MVRKREVLNWGDIMKYLKMKNRIIFYLTVLCVSMLCNGKVYAISGESQKIITPGTIKEWDDGANVTQEDSGKGEEYEMQVVADTSGLEQGYYSVYIYDDTARSIGSFDGMQFHLLNSNDFEMKINLSMVLNSKVSVSMGDTSYVILESESQGIHENVNVLYGTITIPARFDGVVYIPFSQLQNEEGESISINKIQSWGITAVLSENQQMQYSFGNISFLSKSIDSMKENYFLMGISGDNEIAVPKTGAVMENYTTTVKDLDGNEVNQTLAYYLPEEVVGASLSQTGSLEISSECEANDITIYVKSEESMTYGKLKVLLNHDGINQVNEGVPTISSVPRITTALDTTLSQHVLLIRCILGGIALILIFVIYDWFQASKTNYEIIKKKIDTSNKEHEEEKEQ
jgi:hypothetical protein